MLVHPVPRPLESELDQSGEVEQSLKTFQSQEYGCPTSELQFRLENDFVVSISPFRHGADETKWDSKWLSTWTQNNTKCLKSPGRFQKYINTVPCLVMVGIKVGTGLYFIQLIYSLNMFKISLILLCSGFIVLHLFLLFLNFYSFVVVSCREYL